MKNIHDIKIYTTMNKYSAILKNTGTTLKEFSAMDTAIALFGVISLVFYHYGGAAVPGGYGGRAYQALSAAAVLFILIKLISTRATHLPADPPGTAGNTAPATAATPAPASAPAPAPASMPAPALQPPQQTTPKWLPYILLVLLGLAVYIPAIFPNPYLVDDENQVVDAAEWFLANGNFDFYDRAWLHTWFVAQAIRIFGFSTAATRLVSALCGVIFTVSVYHIITKTTHRRDIAVMSVFLLLCNPEVTSIFKTTRMYAMLLPLSLWMLYCIYMTLHSEIKYKRDNALTRCINASCNIHFGYAAAAAVLMCVNYLIHINSMILIFCAAAYIFISAIITKQRKMINLSKAALAVMALIAAAFIVHIKTPVRVPLIPDLIRQLFMHSGLGWYNFIYFWTNISIPSGPVLGILFMIAALIYSARALYEKNTQKAFPAICYLVTAAFFVFLADRYYQYVYMSFLAPVTALLLAAGYSCLATKLKSTTRYAVFSVLAAAIVIQAAAAFPKIYIDDPEMTKFDRPYRIIKEDAENEKLETVPLVATFARRYFLEIIENGQIIAEIRQDTEYQVDYLLERIEIKTETPPGVMYFFSEQEKMRHTSPAFQQYLEHAADFMTDIDASVVYKIHCAEPIYITGGAPDDDNTAYSGATLSSSVSIEEIRWEDNIAYLLCEITAGAELSGAYIIGLEIAEHGSTQTATNKYHLTIPYGIDLPGQLGYLLPLHPVTEENSGDIVFTISPQIYVYYGLDEAKIYQIVS